MSSQIIKGSGTGSNPEAMLWSTSVWLCREAPHRVVGDLAGASEAWCYFGGKSGHLDTCGYMLLVPVSVIDQIQVEQDTSLDANNNFVSGWDEGRYDGLEWVLGLLGVDDE